MDTERDLNSAADATYGIVSFISSQEFTVEAPITHLTRHQVVFALHNTVLPLRTSELLPEFKIRLRDRNAFAGRAVVQHTVLTGTQLVVEATLGDGWLDVETVT